MVLYYVNDSMRSELSELFATFVCRTDMEKNTVCTVPNISHNYLHPHTKAFYYHYGRDKKYNKTVLVGATTN